jgi:hypothetical protein
VAEGQCKWFSLLFACDKNLAVVIGSSNIYDCDYDCDWGCSYASSFENKISHSEINSELRQTEGGFNFKDLPKDRFWLRKVLQDIWCQFERSQSRIMQSQGHGDPKEGQSRF